MLTIRHIDKTVERLTIDDLREGLPDTGFVWIDLDGPTKEEQKVLDLPSLGLAAMALEDMREDLHLPKLDAYEDQFLLTVHAISVEESTIEISTIELDFLAKEGLLITFHDRPVASVRKVAERVDQGPSKALRRPISTMHRILDVMNDVFVPFLDLIERRLDLVEEDILTDPTEQTRREIYELQRDVIQLRRIVVPQAEVIRRLGRDQLGLLAEGDMALFRDIYDHLYRMAEFSESYRQLLDSAMDNYRSALNDDLNEMLKVLTLFSAVLLPISVIAGIYGTNFNHLPETEWRYGYFAMWTLFIAMTGGFLLWFRKRGWIGRRAEREALERRRNALTDVMEVPVLGQVLRVPAYGARAVMATGKGVTRIPSSLLRRAGWHSQADAQPDLDERQSDD